MSLFTHDQTSHSKTIAPSSELKELLVARARLNPHLHSAYSNLPNSPGSESFQTRSSLIPPRRPRTPASSARAHMAANFATPTSFAITEGSQYSPSFIGPDPDTETLQVIEVDSVEADSLSIATASAGSSYSPVILKARRTIASSPQLPESSQFDTQEIMLDQDSLPQTVVEELSSDSSLSRMTSLLGPKLTRHGNAPWTEGSADEYSSDSTNADLHSYHSSPSKNSKKLPDPGALGRIPYAFSHVTVARARRRGSRVRSRSEAIFEIIDPQASFSSAKPLFAVPANDGDYPSHHVSNSSASSASTMGLPRSTSGSSNGTTAELSTTATTPSTSWSSLSSMTGTSPTVKLIDACNQPSVCKSRAMDRTTSEHSSPLQSPAVVLHFPDLNHIDGGPQAPLNEPVPFPSSKNCFQLSADAPSHPLESASRSATPSNLGKFLKTKKSNGFLRTLKKAVGSVTHEEVRTVSGPVGNVVRNGGADPMPSARPIPCSVKSAPSSTARQRNRSLGEKFANLAANQHGFSSATSRVAAPVPSNLLARRGLEGARPALDLRPISKTFSAGFAAELLHGPDADSPPLPRSASPGDSDMSALPSPVPNSSGFGDYTHLPPSLIISTPKKSEATKEDVSKLERQARLLRDEIATLKAERDSYGRNRVSDEPGPEAPKCEKCGCVGGCPGRKLSVLDRPRIKGANGSPLLFSGARDYF